MAAGGKAAELRAGIVVLVGIVILAIGLYLVSGGKGRFEAKQRFTVHFRDAGGIGSGDTVFVAGQRAGEVKSLETVMFNYVGVRSRWVAVTVEIRKNIEIPTDSNFRISKSITNVVQMNIDYGTSNTLVHEGTEGLVGKRLANVDELVDSYQELGGVARQAANNLNDLIIAAKGKVEDLDIEGLQGQARQLLAELQGAATEFRELIEGNHERADRVVKNIEELTSRLNEDWGPIRDRVHGVLDESREAAAEITGILKENREGIKAVVQKLDDGMARLAPVLAQMETIGRAANDAVLEIRPGLTRTLASASKAMENFQALTEDLKTAPWKLINKPSGKESDDVHLYNAARLYVDAAGRVAVAVQDLETLRRLGVLGDPERADLIQRTIATMQEALAEFDANQKLFASMIASTATK